MAKFNDIKRNKMFLFLIALAATQYGPEGLLVRDEPKPRPRPSIWSLYRPLDITLYDLLYEDEIYPNHPDQINEARDYQITKLQNYHWLQR